jgi:hypothetical protein
MLTTAPVRKAADEQLVKLPTGDEMALVFRHSAEEPARYALAIARGAPNLAEAHSAEGGILRPVGFNFAGAGEEFRRFE